MPGQRTAQRRVQRRVRPRRLLLTALTAPAVGVVALNALFAVSAVSRPMTNIAGRGHAAWRSAQESVLSSKGVLKKPLGGFAFGLWLILDGLNKLKYLLCR